LSLSCILAIWKGIEEFGLTLLNTKHLLYLSKFCRFFASSSYLCTKPRVAAVIIHVVQTADFCLYTPSIAILDVCGGKNVDFPRNVFQMRRNLPGFLAISGFLRFFFAPGLSRTS
ncbi:hypothetical protein, partial [Alistipes finegoldii]|uniref:hypothetical protein n=1 Tax=Alistipes finegoldii TaxID=214856 RepID=UPI003AB381D8